MITNFEEITHELTEKELLIVPYVVIELSKYTKSNPVKSFLVVERFNVSIESLNIEKLTPRRLRKICNYIRCNGLLPLIATSNGYYVSNDEGEIKKQIKSLIERSNSIRECASGLTKFLVNV